MHTVNAISIREQVNALKSASLRKEKRKWVSAGKFGEMLYYRCRISVLRICRDEGEREETRLDSTS